MILNLTEFSGDPVHRQIASQLVAKILAGEVQRGAELQPVHILAKEHKVSVSTVERAYRELAEDGWLTFESRESICINVAPRNNRKPGEEGRRDAESSPNEWLADELLVAQQLQASLLPKPNFDGGRFELAAGSAAARPIGGDFYDYFVIDDEHLALVIADACGNGLPAALLISQIQAIVKNEVHHRSTIQQTLQNLNRHVRACCAPRHFVTLFYGILDLRSLALEYVNAGHHLPVLVREDGRFEFLKSTGPALNMVQQFDYVVQSVQADAGALFLLYTDGVTETMNGAREEFGEQRLVECTLRHREESAEDIVRAIKESVDAHGETAPTHDDRTLMVLKIADREGRSI